jgi:DNA adenine methylase
MTKPFLRWIGGKSRLVEKLANNVPETLDTYVEPCCGSAALFFHLRSQGRLRCKVVLSDINKYLMSAYRFVQCQPGGVATELERHISKHSKEYYYASRTEWNAYRELETGPLMAALFIYLNWTNFNGIYRVNRKGDFNVPVGKTKLTFDSNRIFEASDSLQGVELLTGDYRSALEVVRRGANPYLIKFCYADPPYFVGESSKFTSYSAQGFTREDHVTLSRSLAALTDFNVKVLTSNSLAARELYTDPVWRVEEVETAYSVSKKVTSRGYVKELLIKSSNLQESVS